MEAELNAAKNSSLGLNFFKTIPLGFWGHKYKSLPLSETTKGMTKLLACVHICEKRSLEILMKIAGLNF